MPREISDNNLPVILLHNIDPSWAPAEKAAVMTEVDRIVMELTSQGHQVFQVPVTNEDLPAILAPFDPGRYIVFNWCEELPGIPHSEARVPLLLEQLGYAYTGSPPETISFSWDKSSVKARLADNGLSTPYGRVFDSFPIEGWDRFPAIVKPAFEHCSLGIDSNAVVLDKEALRRQVAYVREAFAQPALVEDFIDGREFHVTLWGNDRVNMAPPAEMDFSAFSDIRDRLCTFDSKFTPGSQHYEEIKLRIPAPMSEKKLAALRRISIETYRLLGCRDYARIDLRLDNDIFYVLDVNPNADISSDTSLAYALEADGIGYGTFINQIVQMAGSRHPLGKAAKENKT